MQKETKNKSVERTKLNFKIGADPEFALTMQGRKIDCKQTLEYLLRGKKEFKEIPNNGHDRTGGFAVGNLGNVGWDNHTATAEIRPEPSTNPQKVVNNMAGIFKELIKYINLLNMSTISEFGPIGGHIHLEIPEEMKLTTDKQNAIHRKVSSFYLPILLAENKINLNLRIRGGYGLINDFRLEKRFTRNNGMPGYTYEFRCPSAEWLTTPKIAKATLSYIAVIYNEVINNTKNFTKYKDIVYTSERQGEALQSLALTDYNILTHTILNKTRKYVRQFKLYEEYKEDVEYILNPKKIIQDKIKANYNIAKGWNLETKKPPTKKIILSSKTKMKQLAKEGDFDQIKRIMNIHYNDDTNVTLFAKTLKDRIAIFNWKLKYNYFIFGIRKGIEEIICKNLNGDYFSGRKQIKTIMDKHEVDKLFDKMTDKFFDTGAIQNNTVIDFQTGKPRNSSETSIIIALPYSMRVKEDIETFLELVWNIENDKIVPEKFKNTNELIEDNLSKTPINKRGELYKILTKQTENNIKDIVFADKDTQQSASLLIDEIIHNENNDANDDEINGITEDQEEARAIARTITERNIANRNTIGSINTTFPESNSDLIQSITENRRINQPL